MRLRAEPLADAAGSARPQPHDRRASDAVLCRQPTHAVTRCEPRCNVGPQLRGKRRTAAQPLALRLGPGEAGLGSLD